MTNPKSQNTFHLFSIATMVVYAIIVLGPLLFLSFYTFPNAEEFSLSSIDSYSNILAYMKEFYLLFDGRYSTNFLYYFNPLTYGWVSAYVYMPILFIGLTTGALFYFLSSLKSCFNFEPIPTWKVALSSLFVAAIFFNRAYSMPHILYWQGSVVVFLFPLIMLLIFLGSALKIYANNKYSKSSLLHFIIGTIALVLGVGLNEMSLFYFNALFFIYALWHLMNRKKPRIEFYAFALILLCCTLIFITAPGIWLRKEIIAGQIETAQEGNALYNFFKHNLIFIASAAPPILLGSIVLSNTWRLKAANFTRNKLIGCLVLSIVLAIFTTLAYYIPSGKFTYFPNRIFNLSWGYLLFALLPFMVIAISKLNLKKWMSAVMVLIFLGYGALNKDQNIFKAYKTIWNGEHTILQDQFQERMTVIKEAQENETEVLFLAPIDSQYLFIWYPPKLEKNRNPDYWNIAYEKYFDLPLVLLAGDTLPQTQDLE